MGIRAACAADTIVSEPTCVTGSIGVFGFIPNIEKFMDEKLGITFD
ncbi:MAG: S49 family peptidase, partial [Bacteroidetes bacterium]|nr:S49 family peptidase [Bacteroidota bacterium]